jgi:hypothetical protein
MYGDLIINNIPSRDVGMEANSDKGLEGNTLCWHESLYLFSFLVRIGINVREIIFYL